MERLLHYAWRHKIFPLEELKTTSGLSVEIIDVGLPNHNAGPDFFNAKIKIAGNLWVGNVEIHTLSSDWNRHGHQLDKAYDSVILHVAEQVDTEVYRSNGEPIPQMQLTCPDSIRARYDELIQGDMRPPCYSVIPSLSAFTVHSWLTALQTERLEQKTNLIAGRLKRYNSHWEDVFFITLCRNFGFGINGDAFETWASLLSFRSIDKHRDNEQQMEAFFFGQAGLLDEELSDPYYIGLQKEFGYLKHKFELKQIDPSLWKFLRLRPGNFPHVRIAQLAHLYHKERSLFSRVMESETLKDVKSIFSGGTSAYWETHFNFYKPSPLKIKTLGDGSTNLIVINTVIPFLYAYGLHKGDERLCARAFAFLEEIKAENNYVTRLWDGVGIPVHTAADSQALLQLQKEYCDKKKCLYCRFGYEYLRCK